MYEPGTRVFAVRDANDDTVFLYGFGVYDGDFPRTTDPHPEADIAMAMRAIESNRELGDPPATIEHATDLLDRMRFNPRITLDDDAGTAWGFMCWWGPEINFEGWAKDRSVEIVPLP